MKCCKVIKLQGQYVAGWQSASADWEEDIVLNQNNSLPSIQEMYPGTFNIRLINPTEYVPSDIATIRSKKNQSCISSFATVTSINDYPLEAFIYNGGWPANTIELLCRVNISETLELTINDPVTIEVCETEVSA